MKVTSQIKQRVPQAYNGPECCNVKAAEPIKMSRTSQVFSEITDRLRDLEKGISCLTERLNPVLVPLGGENGSEKECCDKNPDSELVTELERIRNDKNPDSELVTELERIRNDISNQIGRLEEIAGRLQI